MIFRKIEQANCFIIQQIVNETDLQRQKLWLCSTLQDFSRVLATYVYRRIIICYIQMTNSDDFPAINGHCVNLLNNNLQHVNN